MSDFAPTDLYLTAVPVPESYDVVGAFAQARSKALQDIMDSVKLTDASGRPVFEGMWDALPVKLDGKILDKADLFSVAQERLDWWVATRGDSAIKAISIDESVQQGVYYYGRPAHEWCVANHPLSLVGPNDDSQPWVVTPQLADDGPEMTVKVMLGVRFEMPRDAPAGK